MPTQFLNLDSANNTMTLADADYIVTAGDGNNTLTFGNGNDQLTLGNGSNTLTLGSGTDRIKAGSGNNTITINGIGADYITLTGGNNTIVVGDGPDVILAGDGANTVTTGTGNDTIVLGNGFDKVTTGSGNSNITVGNYAGDTVYVGTGSNTITIGTGSADVVHTGGGGNTVSVSTTALGTDSILGGLNTSNGSGNKLVVTTAGLINAAGVSGFETYQLANGQSNALTLTSGNFARLPGGSMTILGGDTGNAINASALTAAQTVNIHGGRGYDTTALGYGKVSSVLTLNPDGSSTIRHGAGVDTFTGVELLTFSDGGQLTAGGDVTGFAALSLSSGLTAIAGSIGSEAVTFNAPASTLQVHGLQGTTTVSGFQARDAIDLAGITGATLTTDASGTTVTAAGGGALKLGTAPTGSVFKLYGDAHGGTNVLLDSPPLANAIEYTDTVTNTSGMATNNSYTGPVDYLQRQYILSATHGTAMRANTPNVFLKGGSGDDALQVTSGNNVLDGGGGSNFLVGGKGADGGTDTFFVDGRGGVVTWSSIVNFHHGDAVTVFGFTGGVSTLPLTDNDGAAGYTGATIHSELSGAGTGVNGSVTFAGISLADAQTKFTFSFGAVGGANYMQIVYTG